MLTPYVRAIKLSPNQKNDKRKVKRSWPGTRTLRVPGEIKRSRDLRGGRWSWTLNFAQKRSRVGRWSWAEQVRRLLLQVVQVVRQQRRNGHCLSDSVSSTAVETAVAQCTSRWAMARGHRLNTSIILAAVHGLSGLFRTVSAVEPSLSRPLPTLSPSLIGHLASVDVKQHESKKSCVMATETVGSPTTQLLSSGRVHSDKRFLKGSMQGVRVYFGLDGYVRCTDCLDESPWQN